MKLFCEKCDNIFSVENVADAVVKCPHCSADIPVSAEELGPGVVIGDFVIEKKLNAGGMGVVYEARQISLDRPVALKVLQKEFTNDREYVASLFREARAAARINHPNIVQAYAVGMDDGYYFLAMELVRGDTLKNILRTKGALPPDEAASIIRDIASALNVAWNEQKLVHQDIKPDNIMVDINGVPKLADLGLAKTATLDIQNDDSDEVLGTPQYISPEQLTGVPTDVRSDIYSLGATFYHIVTGKLPYRAADFTELAHMHNEGKLVPPKEIYQDLPDELNRIIIKMMARNIDERYQNSAQLCADLDAYLQRRDEGQLPASTPAAPVVPRPAVSQPPRPAAPQAVRPAVPQPPRPAVPQPPRPAVPQPPRPAAPQAVRPAVPQPPRPAAPQAARPAVPQAPASSMPKMPKAPGETPVKKGGELKVVLWILIPLLLIIVAGVLALVFMQQNRKPETADEVIEEVAAADSADNDAEDKTVIVIPGMTDGAAAPAAAESPVAEAKPEKKLEASEEKVSEVKRPATEVIVKKRPPVKTSDSTLVTFTVMDLSRPEYLRKAVGLLEWREANLSDGKQFLEKVDQMWSELCYPETEKERALFKKIMIIFSGMDEQYRCIASRENLRQEHSKLVAQDVAKDAEQKAADRQRESERQKLQQEIDRQTRENQLLLQKNEQAMRKRADSLKGEVDLLLIDCVMAMRNSAISGDNKVLEQALKRANDFIANQKVFSPADAKTIREFKALLPQLTKEQKQMREYFKRMQSINEKLNLRILFAYGTELLCGITPGELKYRAGKEVKVLKYDQALPRTRKTLFEVLGKRGKIAHAEFYSDIFHGKRPQDKVVPKGLWKTIWPVVKKSFK